MNSLVSLFILLLIFTSCSVEEGNPVSTGVDSVSSSEGFYVDSVSGSDSNSGTTSCVPFKTISKLQSSLTNGSTVYLKRGSSWNESFHSRIQT